jgi:hypothetical protein
VIVGIFHGEFGFRKGAANPSADLGVISNNQNPAHIGILIAFRLTANELLKAGVIPSATFESSKPRHFAKKFLRSENCGSRRNSLSTDKPVPFDHKTQGKIDGFADADAGRGDNLLRAVAVVFELELRFSAGHVDSVVRGPGDPERLAEPPRP